MVTATGITERERHDVVPGLVHSRPIEGGPREPKALVERKRIAGLQMPRVVVGMDMPRRRVGVCNAHDEMFVQTQNVEKQLDVVVVNRLEPARDTASESSRVSHGLRRLMASVLYLRAGSRTPANVQMPEETMVKPLEDVRIVAVEQFGAGPFCSLHLADLGAEVIKIEDPRTGGDVGRYIPPYQNAEDSLFYQTFNRNKKSLSLDLTNDEGREVFEDLVNVSDVVHSNLRGDVPARLRLTYDDLKHLNPAIVCSSLSGYGMTGPRSREPGYDYMLQGLAGWMALTGEPDGPPAKSGLSLVDFSGGYVAAGSILAGLHAARRDGVGMDCDLSLYDVAINMLTYPATWHLTAGFEPERTANSAHPSLVPFQNFETSDGWIVVGCAKEKFWQRLAAIIGRPELGTDERYATFADRRENAAELLALLSEVFVAKTTDVWIDALTDAGVPCAPVQSVGAALRDAHTASRNMVIEVDHPEWGTIKGVASAMRVGDPLDVDYRRAPTRNEDFDYVVTELLGYDADRIGGLQAAGAFG